MAKSKKYYKKSKGRKTRKHRYRHKHNLGKKCEICSKNKMKGVMKGGSCSSCQMNMRG